MLTITKANTGLRFTFSFLSISIRSIHSKFPPPRSDLSTGGGALILTSSDFPSVQGLALFIRMPLPLFVLLSCQRSNHKRYTKTPPATDQVSKSTNRDPTTWTISWRLGPSIAEYL
ncbi:hypothetical protein VTL71DRAFT_1153 [Oculimacula yallundae]|uniref:Uncharacterized protein n=1 Tax=Oculimacula yallundae TaxID=86028 RepID=A0ABR4D218_9HELO